MIEPAALPEVLFIIPSRGAVQQLLTSWSEIKLADLKIVGHFNLIFNVKPLV